MLSKQFLLDTAERAVKTFAQVLSALITVVVAGNGTLADVNWQTVLSISALATLYSLLTSIGSSTVKSSDSASLVD